MKSFTHNRHVTGKLTVIQERRVGERFPIALGVDFKVVVEGTTVADGHGTTMNLSKTGVLFTPGLSCPSGATAKLSVAWPCHEDHPVVLHIIGTVARSDAHGTAVHVTRHTFLEEPAQRVN
jgi:hypothetical protein